MGAPGELEIRGPGVTEGYADDPAGTATRFLDLGGDRKAYRTGDLGRLRPDGTLEFLGRVDRQVKIRGHRIELAEVEAALATHPGVRECAALGDEDGARLRAFVVTENGTRPPEDTMLRRYLGERLPGAMVPDVFHLVEALPRGATGKVDTDALRAVARSATVSPAASAASTEDPLEAGLLALWREVLSNPVVGVDDGFFASGGHSLLAVRLLGRIREAVQVQLPMADLFAHPSPRTLAAHLRARAAGGDRGPNARRSSFDRPEAARRAACTRRDPRGARRPPPRGRPRRRDHERDAGRDPVPEGRAALSAGWLEHGRNGRTDPTLPGQERIWRLARRGQGADRYALASAYSVQGPLDVAALRHSLGLVAARHPVLTSGIDEVDGTPVRRPAPGESDLLEVTSVEEDAVPHHVRDAAQAPFDLHDGPFLRARLLRISEDRHVLVLVLHHVAADGWSLEVLVEELGQAYRAAVLGSEPALPALSLRYADVARGRRTALMGDEGERLRAAWTRLLTPPPPDPGWGAGPVGEDVHVTALVPAEDVAGVRDVAARAGVTPFMVWAGIWAVQIGAMSGRDDLLLCTPTSGRDEPGSEALIGYLNHVVPLRLRPLGALPFVDFLDDVRSAALEGFRVQALPLHEIAALEPVRRIPLTRALLIYHGEPLRGLRLDGLVVDPVPVPVTAPNFDLTLTVAVHGEGLRLTVLTRDGAVPETVCRRLLESLVDAVRAVVADPAVPLSSLPAPDQASASALETPPAVDGDATPIWSHAAEADGEGEVDALLTQVALVWERVLGVERLSPRSDFFALGGHSLLAVELVEALERETGVLLPLATLVSHPTVAGMTDAIRERGWSLPEDLLVPMADGGGGDPVFLVHSFEGHVFFYSDLARALGLDGPVYGIQAVGIDGVERPQRTVQEMARTYVARMRAVQPQGPYRMAAMCFGIAPTLEMGRLLEAEGERAEIVWIDSAFEHLDPNPSLLAARGGSLGRRLRAFGWKARERVRWWRRMSRAPAYARREMALKDAVIRAWYRYSPTPWAGPVTLVRAQASTEDPERRWHEPALRALIGDPLEVVVVPGDHFTLLRPPAVTGLATAIRQAGAQRDPSVTY